MDLDAFRVKAESVLASISNKAVAAVNQDVEVRRVAPEFLGAPYRYKSAVPRSVTVMTTGSPTRYPGLMERSSNASFAAFVRLL
jgi:hypothetical protein